VINPQPIVLDRDGIRLEPLSLDHTKGIQSAASDGELWNLWFTAVPKPEETRKWIEHALQGQEKGTMLPWAIRDLASGDIIGSTRYHDILANIDRVEIGYTFYAKSRQRSYVNTTCKLMLMEHAFDQLGCKVVCWRTDNFNFRSQRAIEALGAKRDGILRHHTARKDGSARDTVLYSMLVHEWPDARRHLELRLQRNGASSNLSAT
jgi:RimJ/RimL family protein N-acetyltransferase